MKKIKQAAIVHVDGKVYTGRSHDEIARKIVERTGVKKVSWKSIQGFVTDDGEFLTKAEAAKVALKHDQVKKFNFNGAQLSPEDLY